MLALLSWFLPKCFASETPRELSEGGIKKNAYVPKPTPNIFCVSKSGDRIPEILTHRVA